MTTCTFTLRAETGPCERFVEMGQGMVDAPCSEPPVSFDHNGHHEYLGPSLGVCGHAEGDHFADDEGHSWCNGCYDDLNLDEGEEVGHPFQPAAEENVHA